jgi:hypothetical protein
MSPPGGGRGGFNKGPQLPWLLQQQIGGGSSSGDFLNMSKTCLQVIPRNMSCYFHLHAAATAVAAAQPITAAYMQDVECNSTFPMDCASMSASTATTKQRLSLQRCLTNLLVYAACAGKQDYTVCDPLQHLYVQ